MTEPGAGSDLRGMKASARQDGDDWILNGTKHFISHADMAGFAIVFVATGEEETPAAPRRRLPPSSSTRGRRLQCPRRLPQRLAPLVLNAVLEFDDCRVNKRQILGEVHKGFEVANSWLGGRGCRWSRPALGGRSGRWAMR